MAHPQVFISHSNRNLETAGAVYDALERAGFSCWMASRNIRPGDKWGPAIVQAVAASRVLVLVFSADANVSEHVERELELAADHKVRILTFRIENVPPSLGLRYFVGTRHWLDAWTPPLEPHLERLAAAVEALLQGDSSTGVGAATRDDAPRTRSFELREEEARREVDGVLDRLRASAEPVTLEAAFDVAAAAIRHGAGIYNDGSHDGCARIYLHAARGLSSLLERGSPSGDAGLLQLELGRLTARYPDIDAANAKEAAWALRHAFDRLSLRDVVAHGRAEVDELMMALGRRGRAPTPAEIAAVLTVAINYGNVLYQAKWLAGCAELHLHTAHGLLSLLPPADGATNGAATTGGAATQAVRKALSPFADVKGIVEEAEEETTSLAWRLYETFVQLLNVAGAKVAESTSKA